MCFVFTLTFSRSSSLDASFILQRADAERGDIVFFAWPGDNSIDLSIETRCNASLVGVFLAIVSFFGLLSSLEDESVDTVARLLIFEFIRALFCRTGPRLVGIADSFFGVVLIGADGDILESGVVLRK